MSAVSKSVTISPAAAAAAGCTATCNGTRTDYSDGSWTSEYQMAATAQGNWRFVKFTWDETLTTSEGASTTTSYTSTTNPQAIVEYRNYFGSASLWDEKTCTNLVAVFEQVAPTTYTVTATASPANGGTVQVGTAAAGSTSTLSNIAAGSTVAVVATAANGWQFSRWSDGGARTHNITVNSNVSLTAYFSRSITHRLVNSYNKSSPVRLVYDPATNRLVADY